MLSRYMNSYIRTSHRTRYHRYTVYDISALVMKYTSNIAKNTVSSSTDVLIMTTALCVAEKIKNKENEEFENGCLVQYSCVIIGFRRPIVIHAYNVLHRTCVETFERSSHDNNRIIIFSLVMREHRSKVIILRRRRRRVLSREAGTEYPEAKWIYIHLSRKTRHPTTLIYSKYKETSVQKKFSVQRNIFICIFAFNEFLYNKNYFSFCPLRLRVTWKFHCSTIWTNTSSPDPATVVSVLCE